MRVNYDPRYTTPHHNSTLQSRLAVTRDIYGSGTGFNVQKTLKETLEEAAARKKARQRLLQTLGTKTPDKEKDVDNPVSPHGRNRPRKVVSCFCDIFFPSSITFRIRLLYISGN